jgi:predicted N-acetyltransferase YhbS
MNTMPFSNTPSSGVSRRLFPAGENRLAASLAPSSAHGVDVAPRGVPGEGVCPAFAIVAETEADVAARDALLDAAMSPNWRRKSSEQLRRGRRPAEGLALVARGAAGEVLGTVRLWDVAFGAEGHALLLGPLAVDRALKGGGIGAALMRHAIEEAQRLGHGAILLVGDAPYYSRFGFAAEKTARMAMPGPYEPHRFLALELVPGALDAAEGVLRPTGRKPKGVSTKVVAAVA